ncbi:MAG: hypothetical protein ACQEQ4_11020 [Fibrobacterota bacterium]
MAVRLLDLLEDMIQIELEFWIKENPNCEEPDPEFACSVLDDKATHRALQERVAKEDPDYAEMLKEFWGIVKQSEEKNKESPG